MEEVLAGIKLEKYKLLSRLSKGGMATVYLAEHELLKKKVAIKVLLPELAKNTDMVERFLREARAAANLNHPNIIKIHDVGQVNQVHYIAMDFIDGPRLTDHITRSGRLPEPEILRISRQVLSAIGEAHNHRIIHRDLKPHNIMLDHRRDVIIMDFGIAKAAYNKDMTITGSFMGTANYASPEQMRGEAITPGSDLYSWGIVMFEMATGHPPFTGDDMTSIIYQHLNKTPVPPRQLNPEISNKLNRIILKCLKKNPANRYATALDVYQEMNQLTSRPAWGGLALSRGKKKLRDETTERIGTLPISRLAKTKKARSRAGKWISIGTLLVLLSSLLGWWGIEHFKPFGKSQKTVAPPPVASTATAVEVWTEKRRYRIGESIKIHFRARKNGYVFLYHEDAVGNGQFIFPSQMDEDNFVLGGLSHTIPDPNASFDFIVQPPTGKERIKVLYTPSPGQASAWRRMNATERLAQAKNQKDLLVFEVVE